MTGLIEKIGEAISAEVGDRRARPAAVSASRAPSFDIDFAALAAQGFYTPADRSSRLSLELRAIKRALLRRTGLRNANGDRRISRKAGRQRNLVLVTSTRPGEGKTFCAVNLALSLACEGDASVLLVDADLPRPKIRALLGIPESRGLADRLQDPGLAVRALAYEARQAPLAVLGEGGALGKSADLLASAEAQRLFTELSTTAAGRIVIIDAPPVLAAPDAAILARHVDEVVFVVEANATPEAAVGAALDEVLETNPNVSLLLNRCLIGESGSYYGSYGDYDRLDPAEDAAGDGRRVN
jgi:Mrp family chromosome partitioning ATPase